MVVHKMSRVSLNGHIKPQTGGKPGLTVTVAFLISRDFNTQHCNSQYNEDGCKKEREKKMFCEREMLW